MFSSQMRKLGQSVIGSLNAASLLEMKAPLAALQKAPASTSVSFLGAMAHVMSRVEGHKGMPRLLITPDILRAGDLYNKGALREADISQLFAGRGVGQGDITRLYKNLTDTRNMIVNGAIAAVGDLQNKYSRQNGAVLDSRVSASLVDIEITSGLKNIAPGGTALLVGIHASVLEAQPAGSHFEVVEADKSSHEKLFAALLKQGYVRDKADKDIFRNDTQGSTVKIIGDDVLNYMSRAPGKKYDFIADANAALIYSERSRYVLDTYLGKVADQGRMVGSVSDPYDENTVSLSPVTSDDLLNVKGFSPVIKSLTHIGQLYDPSGTEIHFQQGAHLEVSEDVSPREVLEFFKKGQGVFGALGRLTFEAVKES